MGDQREQAVKLAQKLKPRGSVTILNAKTVLRKLGELKSEMKLTDDEVTLLLFTSLDHDHLTDLVCLPSELLGWLTTDFAGEQTEEKDFLASKMSTW